MKILRKGGEYARERARYRLLFGISFVILSYASSFLIGALSAIPFFVGIYFLNEYNNWRKGIKGEEKVIKTLSKLEDNYYLINDVKLPESYGNIDHILIGPNGVFVIETKKYSGEIRCNGDDWFRIYRPYGFEETQPIKSISAQLWLNSIALARFLNKKFNYNCWAGHVLVFTDPKIKLQLNNPTVPIIQLKDLCNHILNFPLPNNLSKDEIEKISKAILSNVKKSKG